jgi:hypothetical protein
LIAYATTWENDPANPVRRQELLEGGYLYAIPTLPALPTRLTTAESRPACLDVGDYLAAIIACGVMDGLQGIDPATVRLVGETQWDGRPAWTMEYGYSFESRPPGDPRVAPTSTPMPGTPTMADPDRYTVTIRYVFYVEKGTMLPLALEGSATRSDGVPTETFLLEYDSETVDRDSVDMAMFDPEAQGYRTEEEIQEDMLDGAVPAGKLYWLGREFDPEGDLPPLELTRVEQRFHPERPELIAMDYDSPVGSVTVAIWEEDAWLGFFARLQEARHEIGNFVFAEECLGVTERTVNGMRARVLAGIDVQPDFGAQATPTPTRAPGEACAPHDTYMLEMYTGDGYVVTLNAPIAVWGPGGPREAIDDPAALLAIAAGLRVRLPGE